MTTKVTDQIEALAKRLAEDPSCAMEVLVRAIREHAAERDALRAEVEGLRAKLNALAGTGLRLAKTVMYVEKMRRAAQSLHRAWKRERGLLPAEMPGCKIRFVECEHGHGRLTADNWVDHGCPWCTVDLARSTVARIRAFVRQLRDDGLDIDDPDTAPTWTGKIHRDGRLVFDLATVGEPSGSALLDKLREVTAGLHASTGIPYSALCHHQDRPHCAGCPDDAGCEASGREPRGTP